MSALHALAHGIMHASAWLAPKDRAGWTRAMLAEFDALEGSGPALEWALGCAAAAAVWRLRANGGYLLAFLVAVATSIWFRDHWREYAQPGNWNLAAWDNTMLIPGLALPLCILAAGRRDRPLTVVLLVIAAVIAASVLVNSQWREVMLSSRTLALPAWAWTILGLMLALPGAIAAAICWRLRADTVYVTALVGLIVVAHWLDRGMWDAFPDPSPERFFALAAASPYLTLALPSFLLCAWRPDRTMLTIFVVSLVNGSLASHIAIFILPILADSFRVAGNHPEVPSVVMAILFSWPTIGAAMLGGAAGWTAGGLGRRFRPA